MKARVGMYTITHLDGQPETVKKVWTRMGVADYITRTLRIAETEEHPHFTLTVTGKRMSDDDITTWRKNVTARLEASTR